MGAPLSAIVLAGGASRRLGQDKAALVFGGRPLLQRTVECLAGLCDEIIVAGGSRPANPLPVHVRFIPDQLPGRGPLAGIQSGLRVISTDRALTVACDMPFLNPALLTFMAGMPRDYQALVPEWAGQRHPLHAIYARSCLPAIDSVLSEGLNAVDEILPRVQLRIVPEAEIAALDPRGLSLFNLNEPQDLDTARSLWIEVEGATSAQG